MKNARARDRLPVNGAASVPPTEPEENDHLLQILMPVIIVTMLSALAIAAVCFRKNEN